MFMKRSKECRKQACRQFEGEFGGLGLPGHQVALHGSPKSAKLKNERRSVNVRI